MKSKKQIIQTVIAYCISAFIIFGASIYNYLDNAIVSRVLWKSLQIFFFALSVVFYKKINRRTIKATIYLVIYLAIYSLLSIAFSEPSIDNLFAYVFCFAFAFMYVSQLIRFHDIKLLLNAYSNLFTIVTLISLFFWLFGSTLGVIPYTLVGYHFGGGTIAHNFFWLYFDEPVQNTVFFGLRIVRNCGLCMEAPGFANLLMFGLMIELIKESGSRWKTILFILGLITNFSSKSYLLLSVAFAFLLLRAIINAKRVKQRKKLLFFLLPVILVTLGMAIYIIVIDKSSNSIWSYNGRVRSLQNAFNAWLSEPILGVGIDNNARIRAGSMGITLFLAQCGILLFAVYLYSMLGVLRTKIVQQYKWQYFLCISMFILNFFISNVGTSTLTILFISIGLAIQNSRDQFVAKHDHLKDHESLKRENTTFGAGAISN